MVIGLFPVFIFTILGMVVVEMAQLNTSVMLTPFTSAPTLTLEAMTQPLFSNHQASSFWPSTALTSTSSSEKGSHTSMMRVRKDSPEYFPPAGEPPPAAPVMAAAALQKVDCYKRILF